MAQRQKKRTDEIRSDFLGIGTFIKQNRLAVPPNQREYAWGDEEVKELIQDFAAAIARNSTYFLGTIVLTETEDGLPEIADGQQRLATTTILLAAIRDYYAKKGSTDDVKSIEDFLVEYDRRAKEWIPKLRLNVGDREFFRKRVLSRPESADRRVLPQKESHKKIEQAAIRAAAHIESLTTGQKTEIADARLNELTDFIQDSVQVITLLAADDASAFVMFETMNDRGVLMTQVDLLKNHLFSLAADRLDEVQQKWARMIATLETCDEPPLNYLRYLLILEYGPTKEKQIMETVRRRINSRRLAVEFVDKLLDHAEDFVAILTPDHVKWSDYGSAAKRHLYTIRFDLRVEQIAPLILAVATRFPVKEAKKAFRLFVNWSVRFLISGGRGGLLDKHYSEKAYAVGKGEITTAEKLMDEMLNVVPPDSAFQAAFSAAPVARSYWARYFLRAIELHIKGDPEPELIPNPSEEIVTLEHVLPLNPSDDWKIDEETAIGFRRRLGNLALLQSTVNGAIGNATFSEKRKIYRESGFLLTSMIAKEREWGPAQIAKRQELLAEHAVKTWPRVIKK